MRLLLINPRFPESFWSFRWTFEKILPGRKTVNPPLGLATIAALCPPHWQVRIVDENIESVPFDPEADVVGICGMGVQYQRQKELLAYYRSKGFHTVAGGSYASLCPELYEGTADTVISGEAEYIWPRFCRDLEAGRPASLYQETGVVSLADSPVPRFDLLQVDRYQAMTIQFSRGCPFLCEFCDIIVMFGRKPRTKSLDQIERELEALRALGAQNVFFVDDNLIGDKRQARELLRFLHDYQQRHGHPFRFGTEASLNLTQDEELLRLFRQAGMGWVFVGIESPDEASLRETRKLQNTGQDLLVSVRTLYQHGLDVYAGFIIGFDHDTPATFGRQYQFIQDSGIQAAMVGLLTAAPRTPLYKRLQKEGRLRAELHGVDNTKPGTNILPKQMTYEAMIAGYRCLYQQLVRDRAIAQRIIHKLRFLRIPSRGAKRSLRETWTILQNFVRHGLLPGGVRRGWHFLRSLPWRRPRLMAAAVEDWIVGLAMQDYVRRHLATAEDRAELPAAILLRPLEAALQHFRERGALHLSLVEEPAARLILAIRARHAEDAALFRQARRHVERLLRRSGTFLTLQLEELHATHIAELERFLQRLARYGDRIRIVVNEQLRDRIRVDSSVFDLALVPAPR